MAEYDVPGRHEQSHGAGASLDSRLQPARLPLAPVAPVASIFSVVSRLDLNPLRMPGMPNRTQHNINDANTHTRD